jgi:hypothetical protein
MYWVAGTTPLLDHLSNTIPANYIDIITSEENRKVLHV